MAAYEALAPEWWDERDWVFTDGSEDDASLTDREDNLQFLAQAKALAEAREGFVKESFYREAEFRAQQAEEARKRAKAEVAELTKVLEQKGRELEDVITEYKVKLEAATDARDSARGAAASLREEVAALKQQHAKELAAEKEASEGIVLAVQAEKTNFEAFVREMSRQILGTCDFVETATPRECLSTATARVSSPRGRYLPRSKTRARGR
ncbi:uncharacterized protein [Lolium perenne]|uniref:uncharacterized protein n=1 Tax=Lolium perenne TaxID=4522 RepID=UPI003A9A17CF